MAAPGHTRTSDDARAYTNLPDLPNRIQHRPINPFHYSNRILPQLRPRRLPATNPFHFCLDVLNWTNRQRRPLHRIQQILPPWINRNPALGDNNVNQLPAVRVVLHPQ